MLHQKIGGNIKYYIIIIIIIIITQHLLVRYMCSIMECAPSKCHMTRGAEEGAFLYKPISHTIPIQGLGFSFKVRVQGAGLRGP
jgi:hypothetical protein